MPNAAPKISARYASSLVARVVVLSFVGVGLPQPSWAALDARAWQFSGQVRERATYVSALDFDKNDPNTGWFWSQRLKLTGDYTGGDAWAGRLTLLSAVQSGIETSPVERNVLDVQEGWVRFQVGEGALTAGRQELVLGSQRLVGSRDGTNVRRTWDGVRMTFDAAGWSVDAFGLKLVEVRPNGAFNDSGTDERFLAGVYATSARGSAKLDLYYLYADFDDRLTIEGIADQDRHSVGVRAFGERASLFWNWEAVYQFGEHGTLPIRAWTVATNTGLRLPGHWSPELLLSVNVASGDSDPNDGRLETFDALYPRGNYFSELAQLGPANFVNLNPSLSLTPTNDLTLSFGVNFHWRLETSDGIYGPPGNIIRFADDSDERFVNTAVSATVEWNIHQRVLLGLSLAHSRPEAVVEDSGRADTSKFAQFTFETQF